MSEKHPDTPDGGSLDDELNEPTRRSMETLGKADLDDSPEPEPEAREQSDATSPGQNSDWLPQ